jgi:alpha-L-arabinofuranosidase
MVPRSLISALSRLIVPAAVFIHHGALAAATTIDVSSSVAVPSVKRFGINLGNTNYWDASIMKNLLFQNPGFEGLLYRSVVECASGTATGCTDTLTSSAWPSGFWNGASYEFIWGTAKGRTGTVVSSTAPHAGSGTSYVFADSGVVPNAGDYVVLRKSIAGDAQSGWFPVASNGATISTELSDLAPGTEGKQAIRLSAPNAGQEASITGTLDASSFGSFLQLNGSFHLSFKAKGVGGNNGLIVSLRRAGPSGETLFIDRTLVLGNSWSTYGIDFTGSETGSATGLIYMQFAAGAPSAVLLDDVSLVQTNSDPTNTTVFRDPVINALRSFKPGMIRYLFDEYGDSLDNQIVPAFARQRTGYNTRTTTNLTDLQFGLHEFLELCDLIGAEPWIVFSVTYSTQEMTNFMEYLGGPATSPYGAKRAARGRPAPWTDAFSRIHLEFGSEAWNDFDFSGATITNPTAYGERGGEIFGIARRSPYYVPSKYDLILGGQAESVERNTSIHAAGSNNDTLAVAPYLAVTVNDFANNEQLFGPLFAEPEMLVTTGSMRQTFNFLQTSSRPLPMSVYEVNIDATQGSISQAALDSFTPSIGAGIAVADHMLVLLRDLGIRNQNLFALTGFSFSRSDAKEVRVWGVTRDLGVTDRKRPQFLALKLANEALAGDLVRTTQSGDNPTWNQPLLNGVTLSNAHYIQSFAFSSGNRRSVIVFNLNRTANLDVDFTGPNAPLGTVTLARLTAPSITDNNENAENVFTTTQTIASFNATAPLRLPPFSMTLLQWQTSAKGRRRAAKSGGP